MLNSYSKKIDKFIDKTKMDKKTFQLLVITILIFVVIALIKPRFISPISLKSMAFQIPELGILVLAISIVMISGGIDLSIVGTANLSAIVSAQILVNLCPENASKTVIYLFILLSIVAALIVGGICGLINGILVSRFNVAPILATLGTMSMFTGISIVITKGTAIYGYPEEFLAIGNSSLGFITVPLIIFLIVFAIIGVLLSYTSFGTRLYLIGTNPKAALFAGIDKRKNILLAYFISGLLAALAGIIIIAKTNSAKADYGSTYVLQAILIAILGGVDPEGGSGKVSGILLGLLSVQFISTGFNLLRVSSYIKGIAWGVLLLFVIILNSLDALKRD